MLRVAATITHVDPKDAIQTARRDVLNWAQQRCGGALPKSAWDGEGFEYFAAGRTTLGARLTDNAVELWALRGDDPDKTVPGRIWTTEIAIGRQDGELPHLSVRLLVASPEEEPDFVPAVPRLVRQIAADCGLSAGGFPLSDVPRRVSSDEDLAVLIDVLEAPSRRLPVFVASGDERALDPARPLIDVDTLARATIGLAHVVVLPAPFTYGLSDAFGKVRSCYHGAVRVYLPGFDSASDPYEHPLTLGEFALRDSAAIVAGLQQFAAKESLRRARLGQDVLAFASVRSAALQIQQETKASSRTSEADRLADALQQIEALRADLAEKQAEAETNFDLAHQEEERAKAAETQLHNARERIRQLEAHLVSRGERVDEGVQLPGSWSEFVDWCDQTLIGRVVLAPAARRGIRKAEFENVALAAQCVLWLATECRDRRLNGGGTLSNVVIAAGIENAPCGEDTFRFEFQGRRLEADWHVKNGGNTRDPKRCLRIYYAWDEITQQIVVAEMPAHRRTGAS
ncbi:hypothetical protein [Elioraea tepidiphila]|uniref:hypothetical protein n=1 Tax=Elioraea tepidiphila TaxID=457934 RepID=UPI0012EBF8DE|nr:hypothetical protein [Elioraea tepidiphila]